MAKCKMYMMCGIAGAGKSTYLKKRFSQPPFVISRDEIRFKIVREDEKYFSHETEVYNNFVNQIQEALKFEKEIFVDATHLNEASRAKLLRSLGASLKGVEVNAIWMRTSLDVALEQNEKRQGTRAYVPRGVIRRMWSQFTVPTKEEGFEHIYVVDNGIEKEII